MFQPNSLRALRDLKLDKELEKNAMQYRPQTVESGERPQSSKGQLKNRSMSNAGDCENNEGTEMNNSDLSDDDDFGQGNGDQEESKDNQDEGLQTMSNNSEYYLKMKQLLEKNPYHPMNFIFDHKDLLQELTQFIQETREWRDTQKKELEHQLEYNKTRAIESVEGNEDLQRKIQEQIEFEEYLENVKQVQEEYNKDFKQYQKFINQTESNKSSNKENQKNSSNTTPSFSSQNEERNANMQIQLEKSKQKVKKMGNIEEYLDKAQMEVEYNRADNKQVEEEQQFKLQEDIKTLDLKEEKLISGISLWENEIDSLLLGIKGNSASKTPIASKKRPLSARQKLNRPTSKTSSIQKETGIEQDLLDLDKDFEEIEKMLQDVQD